MTAEKFEQWCVIELMGHQKIAGKCTEQNIAGANMLRVDVPCTEKQQAFTRFYSASAVYAIHPVDEKTATEMAGKFQQTPITVWDLQEIIKKIPMRLETLKEETDHENDLGF